MDSMKSLLDQYNGVEGKAHGFYKFDVIDFASSGDREDGAEEKSQGGKDGHGSLIYLT